MDEIQKCSHSMKATERYFPVMLFIMLYKEVLTVTLWTKSLFMTIPVKATEQFLIMTLFIIQDCKS